MISLVLPFYNESTRFHLFEDGMQSYFATNKWIKELILVNDGSTDNTIELLKNYQQKYQAIDCKIIDVQPNKGKGNAIKQGILAATQPWILCNDADFSYRPEQIDEWINNGWIDFNKTNAVYFGSRELGQDYYQMKLFLHRKIIGRIYAFFIQLITGITVRDTQCGFKMYEANLAKKIFPNIQEERFAFDVEVHYLLKKENASINLLPVKCIDIEGSKVNLIKDSWQMFNALFRIIKRHR
jgi:dolichyl-phosphate beta-glucosyltransferase